MTFHRAAIVVAAVAVLAAGSYLLMRDRPAAVESAGSGLEARIPTGGAPDLYAQLVPHLEKHPGDARAWAIVARLHFGRDRFSEAATAYARAVAIPGKVARDPLVWCEYADALAMAQGGRLAGRPRELIDRALALDPRHPRALEMAGSAEIERGDYAGALPYWETLLELLPAESVQYRELAAAVARTREQGRR